MTECLYSRHHKGKCYLLDTEELIRVLSEFCIIHFRTMHPRKIAVHMTDMYSEVRRSKLLQQRLSTTTLEHMSNRRKHTKDMYFSKLSYDIAMHTQHQENLARGSDSIEQPETELRRPTCKSGRY